ncbi:uncharacterized protein LOC131940397 isoform X2 [Physella acuta]|nr:uncharacterized protein LOC131940397 isoform X2 [Physella acuta]
MAAEDRRHQMEEKTYAVFTAASVNAMAESARLSPIPHDAAVSLGEDASYRLRQVVMLATQYMKHSKRRRLGTEDFNRAAKELNVMPVHGHGSQDPVSFRHLKDTEMHVIEDPEVNLVDIALGSYVPKQIGQPSIKAHWLAVEGVIKISQTGTSNPQGKVGRDMSAVHLKYYNCLTKALLSANAEAKKRALQDLKTNSNLVPVLPYLVNFVASGIKSMSHDVGHLTTLLNTVRAMLHNRSLYLMHKPYLTTIVQGVEFCVLDPLAASMNSVNDHWVLRDYAARLLAEIVNRWNSPQNHLRFNTIKYLKEILHDTTKPFYSHYGAIMTLIALGHKAVEDIILPHLPAYWRHLQNALEDKTSENSVNTADSHKVHGALRLAAEKVLRKYIRKFQELGNTVKEKEEISELLQASENFIGQQEDSQTSDSISDEKHLKELYANLYEYFGDSLAHCLPLVETHNVFKPLKQEKRVSLGDQYSGKSGEELLDNLMEQIKLQEKLEQERREKELREQKEREKKEREQRARQAIEQMKREEEERKRRLQREEEEQKRRRLEMEESERQKRLKEEEEKRQMKWDEQIKELNRSRTKPQWQQEIELRRMQLEEEIQYSRTIEAKKRQEKKERAKQEEEEEKQRKQREIDEELRRKEEEDEQAGRSRVGLRRRKPVNYTEKDEDISDLFEDSKSKGAKAAKIPRLNPLLPPHSDISDDSDGDRRLAAGIISPATGLMSPSSAEAMAVSKVIDPSKGLLKLKIKRQSNYASTPPHPMSATPQHVPQAYHSPSMLSPIYSPHSGSHSTPPPPPVSASYSHKSSSGSEKETKHKKGSTSSKHSRAWSTGIQDISDAEEPVFEPVSTIPPQLYSPGAESSGSDSNPHRKALKLTLKLTPKDSASE